jgi:hypothetical protein
MKNQPQRSYRGEATTEEKKRSNHKEHKLWDGYSRPSRMI